MSLYNQLMGYNALASVLIHALEIDLQNVPRFRDCWWDRELERIVIYTRTGGGNREAYEAENGWMTSIAGYTGDHDDDYDSTYAHFHYQLPEKWKHIKPELDELAGAPVSTSERWRGVIATLEGGQPDPSLKLDAEKIRKAATSLAKKLDEALRNQKPGDPPTIIET